jgi:5-methylcytosine-specific restriction endonuclease McrBC GTP-binding regulatory subunit McrB
MQSNLSSTNPENKDPNCKSLIKPEFKENKIFFGAPGTGKSTRITQILEKEKVCEKFVTRVTFHPEYDYASFVGGYKPFTDVEGEIKYAFVPQTFINVFIDACNNPDSQYYLIIEEINRGNCAEIFGDLFQLLDRNPKYPITTSKELREYLSGVDSNSEKRIKVATEYWDRENGKMRLPNNITLWATMNTSDQSLMPMDSAFKRRWEWQYIPIIYTRKDPETNKDNTSFKYKVQFGNPTKTFSWIEFIKEINNIISKIDSLGMDKCLGNYFVQVEKNKQDEYLISEDTFINKVLFYLWNDVFKDENDEDGLSIFKGMTFMDFFPKETARVNIKKILDELSIKIDGNENNEHTESINEAENQESDFKITETKTEE